MPVDRELTKTERALIAAWWLLARWEESIGFAEGSRWEDMGIAGEEHGEMRELVSATERYIGSLIGVIEPLWLR